MYIIKKAIEYSKESNGLFDITCAPCSEKIKRIIKDNKIIKEKHLKLKYNLVDYRKVLINKSQIKLKNNAEIDLGGIAKGYIADCAVKILQENGIKNGIVDARGDLRVFGDEEKIIEIQHPIIKEDYTCSIKIKEGGIATSGDYNQFSYINKKKMHHILNPKTKKFDSGCCSVTVIADTTINADAIAKIVFLLGPDKGIEYVDTLDNTECLIVDTSLNVHESKYFFRHKL